MKNVLIVTSSLHIGGAERVIANLAKYVNRDRFNISVCHLQDRGVIGDELQQHGIRVVDVGRKESSILRYLSFLGLRRVIRENNIDLLHSHTTYSLVDACLCRLTFSGIKTLHTFHRGNYPNYDRRYMRMEYIFSRGCDRLVAVGNEQAKTIRAAYKFAPNRIRTILNGVEDVPLMGDPDWAARLRLDGRLVIGSISTLIEQKGITFLLDTAQELRQRGLDPLFIVIGEGVLRPQLEDKCRQLGLCGSVLFTGWVPQAAVKMMSLFDIFFQPSLWEAMSMVVLEAMAAKKPVVVTDVGDNRHVVEHGITGFVVPSEDVTRMADALQALANSDERRQQFGNAGRSRFEKYFTTQVMAAKYEDIYAELLEHSPSPGERSDGEKPPIAG